MGAVAVTTHRTFMPRRPPKAGRRRPPIIAMVSAALDRGLTLRLGSLYHRLADTAVIAGYNREQQQRGRQRRWRRDGVQSVRCMLEALIHCADVRTGFIGRPTDGQRWQRFSVEDLAAFAYQEDSEAFRRPDAATLRRAWRAIQVLESVGILSLASQIRTTTESGIRSEPAVRRLNWIRLAKLTGLTHILKRDRNELRRRHGSPRIPQATTRRTHSTVTRSAPNPNRPTPPPRGGMPIGLAQAIAALH